MTSTAPPKWAPVLAALDAYAAAAPLEVSRFDAGLLLLKFLPVWMADAYAAAEYDELVVDGDPEPDVEVSVPFAYTEAMTWLATCLRRHGAPWSRSYDAGEWMMPPWNRWAWENADTPEGIRGVPHLDDIDDDDGVDSSLDKIVAVTAALDRAAGPGRHSPWRL